MLSLSTHFNDRWRERVSSNVPSLRELEELINKSVIVQNHRDLFTPRGRNYRVLALYWNQEKGLIFKVDERRRKVVTVLTFKALEGGDNA